MHIEINNGGLLGGASINDFQVDLDQFIGASNDILSAFKTVENSTYNLNGGVGSLEEAVEAIGARIREEEHKIEAAIEVQQKTIEFVALANRVDKQVADLVNQNKRVLRSFQNILCSSERYNCSMFREVGQIYVCKNMQLRVFAGKLIGLNCHAACFTLSKLACI